MSVLLVDPTVHVTTLHPGGVACAQRGTRLETLLGSCVAILLTDPRRTVGAMCHVVHAGAPGDGAPQGNTAYGEPALAAMARQLLRLGITMRLCEASLIGGGNMFPGLVAQAHVGERNVRWARQALAREQLRVVYQDVGGSAYRRVAWTVGPGGPEIEAVPVQAGPEEPAW